MSTSTSLSRPVRGFGPPTEAKPGVPAQIPFDSYATTTALVNGRWAVGHSGAAHGVDTDIDWFPDLDWTAVILSNHDVPGSGATPGLAATARALVTGQ
ncbi:hypothetical protein R6V09_52565 [Streptomyces sp. W16]|uniref:hypothetical protein n=1 Tax=Streptomyces sp. W16 TaxID=3076631 RepID=UPI00295B98FD|nr:hypothetical protein [Streptomyces sp. W16]MDV9178745.1 hypothetical protein [Streptomyces sp. W16]